MKTRLNKNPSVSSAGEVALFREMLDILNHRGKKNVFCEEVHQHYVHFYDSNHKYVKCEIADLLLFSLDSRTKRVRISFLQAKREKKALISPLYKFKANFRQFELLSQRYKIKSPEFPLNALNFSSAQSLTTYGVFYNDKYKAVDFFYAAASQLQVQSTSKKSGSLVLNPNLNGALPLYDHYGIAKLKEAIVINGIDAFEKDLLAWNIGAVIPNTWQSLILYHCFNVAWHRLLSQNNGQDFLNDSLALQLRNLDSLADDYGVPIERDMHEWFLDSTLPTMAFVSCDSERND
jgi:hypothetical protein